MNVMVIGLGYWGPNLVRAINSVDNANLYAVSDFLEANLKKVKEKFPHVKTGTDFSAFLDDVEAVFVATPPVTHFDVVSRCLAAGKHVYVEKPITPSVPEAEELDRLAVEKGLTLMVGHIYEYAPVIDRMADVVDSGELGVIRYASSVRANLGRFNPHANVVWDLLPHDLSVLYKVFRCGIERVSCHGMGFVTPGIEDVAYTMLEMENGIRAHVHDSWMEPVKTRRFSIIGDKKMLVLDEGQGAKLTLYDKGATVRGNAIDYYDNGSEELEFASGEPLVMECRHFIDCIHNGTAPRSDAKDGIRVLKTIEAVQNSLKAGGTWVAV